MCSFTVVTSQYACISVVGNSFTLCLQNLQLGKGSNPQSQSYGSPPEPWRTGFFFYLKPLYILCQTTCYIATLPHRLNSSAKFLFLSENLIFCFKQLIYVFFFIFYSSACLNNCMCFKVLGNLVWLIRWWRSFHQCDLCCCLNWARDPLSDLKLI